MPLKNGRTTASIQTVLVGSVIPPGTIAPFGGENVPEGWLVCDGTTVSRTTYSALFEAVGTVHGEGDGVNTFHLPDYRGRFIRGADDMGTGAAGRDPGGRTASNIGGSTGAGVGSVQSDAFQNITGTWNGGTSVSNGFSTARTGAFLAGTNSGSTNWGSGGGSWRNLTFDASQSLNARTSTETRPQNANVNYIIKV